LRLGEICRLFNIVHCSNHQQRFNKDVVAHFKYSTFSKYSSKSPTTHFTAGNPSTIQT